jgi:hypothetical protein
MSINKVSNQDAATLPIDKDSLLYLSELTGTEYATKKITVLALMGEVGLTGTTSNTIRYGADGQAVESDALKNDGTDVTVKNTLIIEGDTDAALYTEGAGATEKFVINYGSPNIPYIVFDKATFDFLIKDGDGLSNLLTIREKGGYSELRGEKGKIHISDAYGGVLIVSDPTLSAEGNGGYIALTDDFVFFGRNFETVGEFGFEFGNSNSGSSNRIYIDHSLDDGVNLENFLESQRDNITGVQLNTFGSKNADIHTFKGVAKAEVQPDTLVDFDTLSYTTKEYVDTRSSEVIHMNWSISSTNTTYTPNATVSGVLNTGKFIIDCDKYEIERILLNIRSTTTDAIKFRILEPNYTTAIVEKTDISVAAGQNQVVQISGDDVTISVTGLNVFVMQIANNTGATQTTELLTVQIYLKVK